MFLIWANPLLGPLEGVGHESLDFFRPKQLLLCLSSFRAQKNLYTFMAQHFQLPLLRICPHQKHYRGYPINVIVVSVQYHGMASDNCIIRIQLLFVRWIPYQFNRKTTWLVMAVVRIQIYVRPQLYLKRGWGYNFHHIHRIPRLSYGCDGSILWVMRGCSPDTRICRMMTGSAPSWWKIHAKTFLVPPPPHSTCCSEYLRCVHEIQSSFYVCNIYIVYMRYNPSMCAIFTFCTFICIHYSCMFVLFTHVLTYV